MEPTFRSPFDVHDMNQGSRDMDKGQDLPAPANPRWCLGVPVAVLVSIQVAPGYGRMRHEENPSPPLPP